MRRTAALEGLSRDHHFALVVAQKLERATVDTAPMARRAFLSYWASEGRHHLRSEEEVLLPASARYIDARDEPVVQVLVEHVDLRRRAADLEADTDPPLHQIRALGDLLRGHVRYEERVLFPLIERAVPAPDLATLAIALADG
jgi:iron-sulfur cluster repair protein YtfE (RIC family)